MGPIPKSNGKQISRLKVFGLITMSLAFVGAVSGCGAASPSIGSSPDEPLSESQAAQIDAPHDSPEKLRELAAQRARMKEPSLSAIERSRILDKYSYLDPQHIVPDALLEKAVTYFDANKAEIANKKYIAVLDYSLRSTHPRFFIINMNTGSVWAIHVAHGIGSDSSAHNGYAVDFSNTPGSNESSLGYVLASDTYSGAHGLSVHLDGLSSSNSKMRSRAIVLHQADYVSEDSVVQGRSNGCPAVAPENRDEVVKRLKGGALMYFGTTN